MPDKKYKGLLAQLQDHFPLDPRPYAVIGRRLHLSPAAVQRRVALLRKKGVIRYIGAVLDTKRIGLKSSLVALAVPPARIEAVSRIINGYSEVTHNYLRDDEYNMWFTVSAPTNARRAALIRQILKAARITKFLDLSTIKVFKINARFFLAPNASLIGPGAPGRRPKAGTKVNHRVDRKVLAALALPLDDSARPLQAIARRLGCTERSVTRLIAAGMEQKLIRRFGAVLDHHRIGLKTNALVAWRVRRGDIASVARFMARIRNVSHCYWRKVYPGWPYTLYTMIHAGDRRQCRAIITLILRSIGHTMEDVRVLFTVKELKKTRFNAERLVLSGGHGTKKV
jgi:siroheme decarboxylase